jgi:hypothetical protein
MDAEEPVVVYRAGNMAEAEMVRNLLMAEGIACEVSGENQGGFAGVGVVEVTVLVHAADADRARAVIEQHHHKLGKA